MGEVKYVKGDLLKSDCTVIMHQANCQKIMGGGIAYAIKQKFPKAFIADEEFPLNDTERYGKYSYAIVEDTQQSTKMIVNLYGQYNPGTEQHDLPFINKRIDAFKSALDSALQFILSSGKREGLKIGLPYLIGCGLAGGNWKEYKQAITEAADKWEVPIYLYDLEGKAVAYGDA